MSAPLPKVLVTGAGGFLGSHLVESLAGDGHPVRAFLRYNSRGSVGHLDELAPELRDRVETVFGDLSDPFAVARAVEGCGVVFHLAALIGIPYSYRAPAHYVETNVRGTLHLLEACRAAGVSRLVHTSTSEVYGSAQVVPIPAGHPIGRRLQRRFSPQVYRTVIESVRWGDAPPAPFDSRPVHPEIALL